MEQPQPAVPNVFEKFIPDIDPNDIFLDAAECNPAQITFYSCMMANLQEKEINEVLDRCELSHKR